MKVLMATRTDGAWTFEAGADSAVLRPAEPVFIEEPAIDWTTSVVLGIRISRLGMHISTKNVMRHCDALAPFHILRPAVPYCAGQLPPLYRDRAISPGAWVQISELPQEFEFSASRRPLRSQPGVDIDLTSPHSLSSLFAEEAVSILSQAMTFKTGDIILFGHSALTLGPPAVDTEISASIDGRELLDIRIK